MRQNSLVKAKGGGVEVDGDRQRGEGGKKGENTCNNVNINNFLIKRNDTDYDGKETTFTI